MKTKEYKIIADGLCSSFVSRNNDVHGYWGIGKLFSLMESTGHYQVEIDLLNNTIEPLEDHFLAMIKHFSDKLTNYQTSKQLTRGSLLKAEVLLAGFPNQKKVKYGSTTPHLVTCSVVLETSNNKRYTAVQQACCRAHNPKLELKSTRVYTL